MKEDADFRLLVSIIIPVFNVALYLREALDSVINQTYRNLEIIIIDDGSTDGSSEICNEYAKKDNRFRVIHQENKGLSAARNLGIDVMNGDAVVFLDSDDAYHPDFVTKMINSLVCYNTDMVVCNYSIHYTTNLMKLNLQEEVYPLIKSGIYNRRNALQALIDGSLNVNVWNKIYRSKLWDTIRFSEGHVYEDNEVAYRIIELSDTICVINTSLYLHRKRPGSITTTQTLDSAKDLVLSRNIIEDYVKERVSECFTEEQLKKIQQTNIKACISIYLSCFVEDRKKLLEFRNELRNQIIDKARLFDTPDFCVKIAIYMIRYCPWLLRITYKVYRPIRIISQKKGWKIFGK